MNGWNGHRKMWGLAGLLLTCMLLAACEKDFSVSVPGKQVPLSLLVRAPLQDTPATKAGEGPIDGTVFPVRPEPYDIGMWICESGSYVPTMTGYENLKAQLQVSEYQQLPQARWSYFLNGSTTSQNDLWTVKGKPIDVYAYYPHSAVAVGTVATLTPSTVPVVLDQTDILYTGCTQLSSAQTNTDPVKVALEFKHALACIQIRLTSEYADPVSLNSVVLFDRRTKADPSTPKKEIADPRFFVNGHMNLKNGVIDNADPEKKKAIRLDNIQGITVSQGTEQVINILIPPVADYKNNEFILKFTFGGISGIVPDFFIPNYMGKKAGTKPGDIFKFEAGKRYVYKLTLAKELYFAPVKIEDAWVDEEITIEM